MRLWLIGRRPGKVLVSGSSKLASVSAEEQLFSALYEFLWRLLRHFNGGKIHENIHDSAQSNITRLCEAFVQIERLVINAPHNYRVINQKIFNSKNGPIKFLNSENLEVLINRFYENLDYYNHMGSSEAFEVDEQDKNLMNAFSNCGFATMLTNEKFLWNEPARVKLLHFEHWVLDENGKAFSRASPEGEAAYWSKKYT